MTKDKNMFDLSLHRPYPPPPWLAGLSPSPAHGYARDLIDRKPSRPLSSLKYTCNSVNVHVDSNSSLPVMLVSGLPIVCEECKFKFNRL